MRVSPIVTGVLAPMLSSTPGPTPGTMSLQPRAPSTAEYSGLAAPTAPWVAVDALGTPTKTYTPRYTTHEAKTSLIDAPPYEITGTLFTEYHPDRTVFATRPPAPTAEGEGSFPVCEAKRGEKGFPFCWPGSGDVVWVDSSYYVTWNPSVFNETRLVLSNETRLEDGSLYTGPGHVSSDGTINEDGVILKGKIQTTGKAYPRTVRLHIKKVNQTDADDEEILETDLLSGTIGMHLIKVTPKWMNYRHPTNISFSLISSIEGIPGTTVKWDGPIVTMMYRPWHQHVTQIPKGDDLWIALPLVVGFILVISAGLYYTQRTTRSINIGSIMGRKKHPGIRSANRKRVDEETMDDDDIPLMGGLDDEEEEQVQRKRKKKVKRNLPNPFDDYPSHVRVSQGAVVRNPGTFYEDLERRKEEDRRRIMGEEGGRKME